MPFRHFFSRRVSLQILSTLFLALVLVSCSVSNKLDSFDEENSLEQLAVTVGYTKKYGTALSDNLTAIATDALGNVYITGNSGSIDSSTGFLRKYNSEGTLLWQKIRSVSSVNGVTLDKNGNIYIVGSYASGTYPSRRSYIYLEKYHTDGLSVWTKQFTTPLTSDPTYLIANGIATDPRGHNFIVILFEKAYWPYQTREVLIRKYNVSGGLVWEKAVASSSPYTARPSLATDKDGYTYTAINTASNQQWNALIKQFDTQGNPGWSTPIYPIDSPSETYVHGITADPTGNIYVAGITKGSLEAINLGYFDAFVRKYDSGGAILWTRQFGTNAVDYANSLTTDAAGNIYIAGSTMGVLGGSNRGSYDAIIRKYGTNGNVLRTRQFGTSEFDSANGIKLDASGNVYIAGHSYGNLGGANKGGQDIYFRKYTAFQ